MEPDPFDRSTKSQVTTPPTAESSAEEDLETGPLSPHAAAQAPQHLEVDGGPQQQPAGRRARLKAWCCVLWRRAKAEFWLELPLLQARWLVTLLCLVFQYVHAIFTALAYHLHEPLPEPLHDTGFEIFPELGESNDGVSEAFVYCGFGMFAVWLLSPFVTKRKTFHSAVVFKRVLVMLVTLQVLRIITFLSTQIPAPNYHCRAGSPDADAPFPEHWWQNIIVNVSRQASKSCGDLIFSSHATFLLVFMWTYCVLGKYLVLKVLTVLYVAATSCLIISSRKHYTVDVVVAWYVVPLAFFHFKRRWTTVRNDVSTPDGSSILPAEALPLGPGPGGSGTTGSATLPLAAPPPNGKMGHSGALGGLEGLLGKLRLAPTKKAPQPAERAASQHLLAAPGTGGGLLEAGLPGCRAGPAASGSIPLAAVPGRGEAGGSAVQSVGGAGAAGAADGAQAGVTVWPAAEEEEGALSRQPSFAHAAASPSAYSLEPAGPVPGVDASRGGASSSSGDGFIPASPSKRGVGGGLLAQARALPARVAGLVPAGRHQRSESIESSTVALRQGERASSSSAGADDVA